MNREQKQIIRSGRCVYYDCNCHFPKTCIWWGCAEDSFRQPLRPMRADFGWQHFLLLIFGVPLAVFAFLLALVTAMGPLPR